MTFPFVLPNNHTLYWDSVQGLTVVAREGGACAQAVFTCAVHLTSALTRVGAGNVAASPALTFLRQSERPLSLLLQLLSLSRTHPSLSSSVIILSLEYTSG